MLNLPRRGAFLLALLGLLASGTTLHARPPHKKALSDYFGASLAPKLNDCQTCHLPEKPGQPAGESEDRPHNPFGTRLKAVRAELLRAEKKTDIISRLETIANEDSDGDGVANLLELITGHHPGDPNDRPDPKESAVGKERLASFLKARLGYAWRPFEPVQRPPVPAVQNGAWVRNPLDAFIAAEHEARGLKSRPEAPKNVLLRRVYLDLIGLPPTPEELRAFREDFSPDAYEKVVDRLLNDPRHGERWGRHWMDVWRYSDWAGFGAQVRDSQPHIWRWRDWIVEALNQDKGYDRMVLEMLAADELAPEDPNALRATGYLVRNYKLLSREKWLQDTVEHTSQAFLGITLACARCHDHMFDPLLQREYYQVRAIFEPHQVRTDRVPGEPDTKKDGLPRVFDKDLEAKTFLFLRGDDRTPDKTPLAPGVPEVLGGRFQVEQVPLPLAAHSPDKRSFVIEETLQAAMQAGGAAGRALTAARASACLAVAQACDLGPLGGAVRWAAAEKSLEAVALAQLDEELAWIRNSALVFTLEAEQLEDLGKKDTDDWKGKATNAVILQRQQAVLEARHNLLTARRAARNPGLKPKVDPVKQAADAEKALARAEEAAKQPLTTAYTKRAITTYPDRSTGRRLAFARWLTSRDNPLAARVAVNHVWLRHFGQAIVPSVFDFGRNGRPPSHPALLDWLAAEFMERGWSLKALHRLMVTSATYRMDSTPDEANLALDHDNRYLWRTTPRRLEAEVVRDGVFFVAGRLDQTMGGPEIDQNQGLTSPRRSLYFRHAQEKQMEFLKIFDAAAVTECYHRKESILPQQSLALFNSELTLRHAQVLAKDVTARVSGDAEFTTAAFERVLSRPPTEAEAVECVAFLREQTRRYSEARAAADPALRARANLVHVLLNHHDFVTVR